MIWSMNPIDQDHDFNTNVLRVWVSSSSKLCTFSTTSARDIAIAALTYKWGRKPWTK
jgi:hypothetical protein